MAAVTTRLADDLARGTSDLPVLPPAAEATLALANGPTLDPAAVIAAAERDPPLAARILAVASASLHRRGPPVASLHAAAMGLGPHDLRDVLYLAVYSTTVFNVPRYRDLVAGVFRHSVVVARAARELAERTGADGDAAFLAGLLHDVGRARCLRMASRWLPADELTDEVLSAVDVLHTEAGASLARAWHLPDPVEEACAWHHDPGDRPTARLVAAADALAHAAARPVHGPDEFLFRALAMINLGPFDADPLLASIRANAA